MILKSINVAAPKSIIWRGKSVQTGIFKKPVNKITVTKNGIPEDFIADKRYHGDADKIVYAYSLNHYSYFKSLYPDLKFEAGMFGENITIEGLFESDVHVGDQLKIGDEVVLEVSQPRQPCYKLGVKFGSQNIVKQFAQSDFPGVYFRVIKEGTIKAGDGIKVLQKGRGVNLLLVWRLMMVKGVDVDAVKACLNDPYLAEDWKKDLAKKLNL